MSHLSSHGRSPYPSSPHNRSGSAGLRKRSLARKDHPRLPSPLTVPFPVEHGRITPGLLLIVYRVHTMSRQHDYMPMYTCTDTLKLSIKRIAGC